MTRTYMRVAHHTSGAMTIQLLHDRAVVSAVAGSVLLLLAELALSTGHVEGSHDAVAGLDFSHLASDLLHDTHTFVAEDLARLEL